MSLKSEIIGPSLGFKLLLLLLQFEKHAIVHIFEQKHAPKKSSLQDQCNCFTEIFILQNKKTIKKKCGFSHFWLENEEIRNLMTIKPFESSFYGNYKKKQHKGKQ